MFVPLRVGVGFDKVREFAQTICERLAAEHSDTLTMEQRIEARKGRVFLDAMRNSFGATVAAPYSVRRRPKASFSMPLRWKHVTPDLDPSEFNLGNYQKHIAEDDPWSEFFKRRQSLKLI